MFPFVFPSSSLPDELGMFIPIALVVGVIAILVVGRRDAGSSADRVGARYMGAVSLLTLFVALFAAYAAAQALTDLVVDHRDRVEANEKQFESEYPISANGAVFDNTFTFDFRSFQFSPNNDANYNAAVASGLAALTTGAVFVYHRRRRLNMVGARGFAGSPAAAVNGTYLQSVKFVAALTVALGAAAALYGIWQIVAPGIAGAADADVGRAEGISAFLSSGLLTALAGLIFLRASNEFDRS